MKTEKLSQRPNFRTQSNYITTATNDAKAAILVMIIADALSIMISQRKHQNFVRDLR